ncbi:MFS transporter [Nocardia nova]|uniref:MFS transporter n=1 Tax=Nocardia nova TaxID=37330 RepID=UPI00379C09AB
MTDPSDVVGSDAEQEQPAERWLTPGVAGIGAASFFSDTGHEATTSVLPTFLTSTLGASAGALGIVEGFSDALIGIMKLIGGPLADDPERRRRIATGGYLGTALATGAIGLAVTVWQAGLLRAFAWISRGLRGPARDSLLASLVPKSGYGRAFGLERAGDNLGAVAGPLLAAGLVTWVGIRPTMLLAAIPGLFAAGAVFLAAREARRLPRTERTRTRRLDMRVFGEPGVVRALLPVALFEFGNLATTLLILRATQLLTADGRSVTAATSLAILIYAGHNVVAAVASLVAGHWLDKTGPRVVFACGAAVYVVGYAVFAVGSHQPGILMAGFALAGAGIGLAEPTQSAVFAHLLPDNLRGSGFGVLGAVQAAGDLVATVVAGLLYAFFSPAVAFGYAAVWMAAALTASGALRAPKR